MGFREEVSVIIPTYNGAHRITTLLESLAKQSFQNFRIYIGIDGSVDNTREIIENQNFIDNNKIFVYEQPNQGRSVIRNNTAAMAKSKTLIFLDDDIQPESELIEKHYQHHLQFEKSILGGSQIDFPLNNESDYLIYRSELSSIWLHQYNNGVQKINNSNLFITAANFSISKQLFLELGGFDERLTDAEDWDLAARALENKIPIFLDTSIVAYHLTDITLKQDIIRQREYIQAHKILIKNKPELYKKKYNRLMPPKLDFKRRLMYWLFARSFNVYLIDHFNIYMLFPKKIRYKIYTLIKTGLSKVYPDRAI